MMKLRKPLLLLLLCAYFVAATNTANSNSQDIGSHIKYGTVEMISPAAGASSETFTLVFTGRFTSTGPLAIHYDLAELHMKPLRSKQFGYELAVKELTHSDVSFTSIFFNDARVRKLKASYIVYLVESVPFLTTMRITHELASTAVGNGKGERTSVEEFQLKNRHLMTDGTFRVFPSIYLIRSTRDESKAFTLLVETFASHSDQFQTKFTVKDNNQIMTMAVNYLLVSHITRLQSSTAYPDLQSIAGKLIEVYISGHEYRGPTVTQETKPMLFVVSYQEGQTNRQGRTTVIMFTDSSGKAKSIDQEVKAQENDSRDELQNEERRIQRRILLQAGGAVADCANSSDGNCTQCNAGFGLNASQCVNCTATPGSYFIAANQTCGNCSANCSSCSDNTTCTVCNAGFGLNASQCVNCTATPGSYFVAANQTCGNCSANCSSCSDNTTCTVCNAGFGLNASQCVNCTATPGFYFVAANQTCGNCLTVSNCSNCSNISGCTSCNAGFGLKDSAHCVNCTATPGFYFSSSTQPCHQCFLGCSSCSNSTNTGCISCLASHHFSSNHAGGCQCDSTHFFSLDVNTSTCQCFIGYILLTSTCVTCSSILPGCSLCFSLTICNECNTSAHWILPNNSVTCACISGYGTSVSGSQTLCVNCSLAMHGCLTCISASICTSCNTTLNLILINSTCSCGAGYILDQSVCKSCQILIPGCQRCTSSLLCTSCDISQFRQQTSLCSCLSGYYEDSNHTCQLCSVSLPNCLFCSNGPICITCSQPYILVSGQCQEVPSVGGIAIPATITTGKTKCSLSQTIVLTYQPTFDLTLTITPPSTTSNNFSGFITIDGTVTNSIRFDPSKSAASISVCSFMSTTAGTYPFSLSLSGTNMSSYALTNPTLNVSVKEMMTLTFPTAVDVPRSGCSPRQQVKNPSGTPLPGVLYVRFGSDNGAMYFGNTSANTLTLGPLTVYPITFTVCSDDTVIEGTYNQKISFSGASSPVVQGNVNSINVTISGIPVPTFSVDDPTTDVLSGERFSNITITANAGGTLYYLIKETDETTTSVSFTALKVNVTVNKLTIESQRDYLTRIYDSPRDRRIGAIAVSAGNPTDIVFSQYFPGTNYLFCGYLQTKDESSRSNLICRRIVTPPQQDWIYYLNVTMRNSEAQLSESDRQAFLCYWQGQVSAGSTAFTTNLRGERCSSLGFPPLYKYKGQVSEVGFATFALMTNDTTAATNQTITIFSQLTGKDKAQTIAALNSLLSNNISNFATGFGSYLHMKNAAAPSLPSISDSKNNTVTIANSQHTGSILVGVGNTTSPAVPSREQLYNCLDGNNSPLYVCKRFILSAASSDILLSVNGQKNHVYVATINSYVYRLLGYGTPMNKTITAQGTAIKIPDFIAVAPGSCSSNVSISTTAAPTKDVSIVPSPVQNISYQDSFKTVTNITITNSATTTFNVCATVDRTPGIIHVPITLDGQNKSSYYPDKGELIIVVSAPLSYQPSLSFPVGGCSSWQNIALPMLPPTQVNASLAYSSSNASAAFMSNPGFTIISPGDYNSTTLTKQFKICSNSSVSTSLSYNFTVKVSGTDSAYYVATNPDLNVTVFSTLGNITTSTNATIPKGGCSILLSIAISKLPESDVNITISNLAVNKLYTNLTSNSVTFSASSASLSQSFLICSNESAVDSTGTLPFTLTGTNSNDYLLKNGDNITFTITAAPSPTIVALPPKSYTAGQGVFGFSSNIEGKYYCSVREGVFANDTNSLSYYKGLVDSNSTTIQSSADFLTRLYPQPRDWSVVSTNLLPAATSNVTLLNKRPETNYSFCCYYQNTAGTTTTGPSCNTYLTPPDDTWKRHSVIFTFTTALSATQRNKLLGFMATTIGGPTSQIVNRRGESYSNATTTPKKEWYVYSGGTDSKNSDTVFLTVKDSSSALTYVQNLGALFEANGSLTLTASSYINNSIDGLLLTGRYNLSQGYASTLVGSRIANIPTLLLNQTGSYISVSNVQLDYPGSVMFGVGLVNSTLPSQEQLMNCQDGLNTSFVSCARFIVNDGNTNNTFVLQNVTGSNRYKVYYLPTNDFVERPVAAGDVLAISVSNLTYSITLPQSTISLSKQGCSVNQTITISPAPFSNVYVSIGNGALESRYSLYLRDQSDNNVVFAANSTSQTFAVCSYTNTSQGSKTIQVAAVGDTLAQYLLNTNSITVSVVQPIPPTPPVIDDKETKFEGSTGTINIISNRTGKVHWTGSEKGSNIGAVQGEARSGVQAGIEASQIKVGASQSDFLNYIYDNPRDERSSSVDVKAGQPASIVLSDLKPGTNYNICSYFTTVDNSTTTTSSCTTVTTPDSIWTIHRMLLTFSINQTVAQRNALLCSFSNLVGAFSEAQYQYVINRESESCYPKLSYPASYWYNYRGITYDDATQIIYLIQVDNSTTSQAQVARFNSMVDTTSKVMTPLTLTILSNSVNHTLNKGELMDTISYATMRDQSRNVTVRNVTYNQTTRSVFVNITVDAPSIVYLVMQAKTTPDPNNEQVMNCFDGDNNTALNCFRLVANRASTINVELPQMVQGDYRVAYISTNEFIFRPKTTSTFPTTVNSTTVFGGRLALVAIAVIITLLASM